MGSFVLTGDVSPTPPASTQPFFQILRDLRRTSCGWLDFTLSSHVWYTFEALQKRQDHVPAVLRCQFQARGVANTGPDFRRRACRPNDLDPTLDVAAFHRVLAERPQPPWELSVDTHFAQLSHSWLDAGRALQQPAEVLPRQSYLSLDTLRWVGGECTET